MLLLFHVRLEDEGISWKLAWFCIVQLINWKYNFQLVILFRERLGNISTASTTLVTPYHLGIRAKVVHGADFFFLSSISGLILLLCQDVESRGV